MQRDPREDPRPGDAIEIAKGWYRIVTGVDPSEEFGSFVMFNEKGCPRKTINDKPEKTEPLAVWKSNTKDALVLSRGVTV